jgi:hypothetical protein
MSRVDVPKPPKKRYMDALVSFVILCSFLFIVGAVVLASLNDARKPAIYLYPTEDSMVQVQVDVRGIMYKDIPKYNGGWNVFATKEGIIDGQYDYLFYEALLWQLNVPEEGWVVPHSQLEGWFNSKLPELGLNENESAQFMEYWLAELPEANYYEVKLFDDAFVTENLRLDIEPVPDTIIRLLFHFRPLDETVVLTEPTIYTPERNGFTVVEWGGILSE